jgi:hypothetical protein
MAVEWSCCQHKGASHCDKVGAAVLVLVLVILVVTVCVGGARFVGGVVGAAAGDVEVH